MIVPLASIAIGGGDARIARFAPWATGWSGDRRFIAALALFLGAMAARSALLFARDVLLARLAAGYEADLRLRAASTLASRGWPFASRIGQGGMQALLLSDVPRAAQAISYVQGMAAGATMLVVPLVLTSILSAELTLVALLFLAVAFLLSVRITKRGVMSGFAIGEAMDAAARVGVPAPRRASRRRSRREPCRRSSPNIGRASSGRPAGLRFVRDYSSARQLAAFGGRAGGGGAAAGRRAGPCPAVSGPGRQPGPVCADERPRRSCFRTARCRRRRTPRRSRRSSGGSARSGSAVASAASRRAARVGELELDRAGSNINRGSV